MAIPSNNILSAPTGLYADNITATSFILHWDKPEDFEEGSHYIVYVKGEGSENIHAPTLVRTDSKPMLVFNVVKPATEYSVYVIQENLQGTKSSPSNTIMVMTLA